MLNRTCQPQKQTILKLAEALNVQASDLWPDIDMTEMLDAVASFQQDDHVMTEAEARTLPPQNRTATSLPYPLNPARSTNRVKDRCVSPMALC